MVRDVFRTIFLLFLLLQTGILIAQEQVDTVQQQLESPVVLTDEPIENIITDTLRGMPYTAAMFSATLPGLGQAYNKKYWKMPVILGSVAVLSYFLNYNHQLYLQNRNSLIAIRDLDPRTQPHDPEYSETSYERATDYWRRNRDLLIIGTIILYVLNIVEAHVDAHLSAFTSEGSLSLKVQPSWERIVTNSNLIGVSIIIKI